MKMIGQLSKQYDADDHVAYSCYQYEAPSVVCSAHTVYLKFG